MFNLFFEIVKRKNVFITIYKIIFLYPRFRL